MYKNLIPMLMCLIFTAPSFARDDNSPLTLKDVCNMFGSTIHLYLKEKERGNDKSIIYYYTAKNLAVEAGIPDYIDYTVLPIFKEAAKYVPLENEVDIYMTACVGGYDGNPEFVHNLLNLVKKNCLSNKSNKNEIELRKCIFSQ
jgi:hypothetical protein